MRPICVLAVAFVCVLLCVSLSAQEPSRHDNAGSGTAIVQSPPAQTTNYTLPPDKLAKATALYNLRGKLRIIGTIYSFLVLLLLLYTGTVARFRDWAEAAIKKWRFVQAFIVVPLLMLTLAVFDLPLSLYEQHVSLQYGLSVQGWGSWWADFLKIEGVFIGLLVVVLWLLMTLIRHSPTRWWLYAWLIALPIMVFLVIIVPVVLDPLFNKFEPLEAKQPKLVEAIEKVVQRGGLTIPRSRMFEMNASEKTTTLNAYVTGLGPSKRVVVWDTTIQKMTQPETLFVFGHEMGHYVLNHIYNGLAVAAVALFVALYLLYRVAGGVLARFGQRWRIRSLDDWAALPMIFLLLSIFGFLAQPLLATYSRHQEHEADVYGLEVSHGINANSQEAAAHAFQTLGEISLSYPNPSDLVVLWYYDHPPVAERVRFAHEYDPWSQGQSPKYVH